MKALRLDPPEVPVRVRFTAEADSAIALPEYKSEFAAGLDVSANFAVDQRASGMTLAPGARALIPTGLCIAVPAGFEMQLRPRSGLALEHGITLLNSPGTVDSDYRGEVKVLLINLGQQNFVVEHGTRIAQMVLSPVTHCNWVQTDKLDFTKRGRGGFGSTGT